MAAVIEPEEPVHAVHIDGLAVLKIVKHCQESLPNLVTGSLLGLTVENGVLEITHAFPFPEPRDDSKSDLVKAGENNTDLDEAAALDGHEYQLEMMKMLREVNVDNNCVGWYQSMYLGSYSTASLLENQFSYQTDLSPNAVVLLYDPMQTTRGNLSFKCLRLAPHAMQLIKEGKNKFLEPSEIFEELPITIKNPSLVKALLYNVASGDYNGDEDDVANGVATATNGNSAYGVDTTFDRLDLSTNPYLEKHLEFLCTWVDDLASEQNKFQYYMRGLARNSAGSRFDKRSNNRKDDKTPVLDAEETWSSNDAPKRIESLLINNQIRSYCDQVGKFADNGFGKLFLTDGLHRDAK